MFNVQYIHETHSTQAKICRATMTKEEIASLFKDPDIKMVLIEGSRVAYGRDGFIDGRWHNNYHVGINGLEGWLSFIGPMPELNWAEVENNF